ncbi:uncharacterized protein I303_105802 [Kwoniella dejecticola CBS 10117]|uniref:Pali-domain-containing protein n=1 Tax=Kwoniella dejecticola CBS 10117 TaxID=1296121 RepID=A0A1A6A0E9_9TREE|nr:uncharacterized protein I303_05824 [Kwoniella dejecticola CBS 10117]OBR83544.1 hypothetical protein I303_05824 [Kwoniella dejecticola CBS 10117]
MAIRYRNATPGTLVCLIAAILLAVVSFNTPLLKSLNFLKATYSSGQYSGEITLGTLGFCHTLDGTSTCTGPQVGYEFDPNDVFGVTIFDIPEAVTKYLTYVLILHVVALAFAVLAVLFGLIAHSPTFAICWATTMATLASGVTLLALIFDLAMFYIARARINNVSGASADIGMCVWLTLAAWIILALSGCFFGIGSCCGGCRGRDEGGDPKRRNNNRYDNNAGGEEDYKMRMMAIDNERQRKQKQEQGLPSFQELVKDDGEDKYLIEPQQHQQQTQGGLRRDGSVLQGVGMGYGRRANKSPPNEYNNIPGGWGSNNGYQNIAAPPPVARRLSDTTTAGDFVGVGAGGGGVDRPQQQQQYGGGNGYYDQQYGNGSDQGHGGYGGQDQHYQDPYSQNNYNHNDPYSQPQHNQYNQQDYGNQYSDPYRSSSTQPYGNTNTNTYPPQAPIAMSMPTPGIQSSRSPQPQTQMQNAYDTSFGSTESHYNDPGPQVRNADPYDGYDDGLGAIGMAVTGNQNTGRHERDYTGQTFGQNDSGAGAGAGARGGGYDDNQFQPSYGHANENLHQPSPQHLLNPAQSSLLRSPVSPMDYGASGGQRQDIVGTYNGGYQQDYNQQQQHQQQLQPDQGSIRPPSYSAGDYAAAGGSGSNSTNRNEKSSYRY